MAEKTCRRCGEAKPTTQFRADPRYRDGFGSWCAACHQARGREWTKENAPRLAQKVAAWRAANPTAAREANVRHKVKHKARLAAEHAQWAKTNADKRRASTARRKAARLRATPAWADQAKIAEVYRQAAEIERLTGERMHVDHIVPLQHPLVCGLHCEANLQILPGSLNEAKRNKWSPDEEAYRQPRLFDEPKPKAEQIDMLGAA